MNETLMFITGPIIAAFATWFFAMRKTAAEAASLELSNTAKIITMWRELSTGMELRFKDEVAQLRKDNYDLETKVKVVEAENEALLKKMRAMEEENIRFFSFITQNTLNVVFIVLMLNFIWFTDRVLLPLLFNRWKRAS